MPSVFRHVGDRWSAGTGSVYTARPLYMSEELADKTRQAGPAPTFPSTPCLWLLLWLSGSHPCGGLLPTHSAHSVGAEASAGVCPLSGSGRPREPRKGQRRETAEVTLPKSYKIRYSGGHQRLPCPSVTLPRRSAGREQGTSCPESPCVWGQGLREHISTMEEHISTKA